jgi:hemerythrin-like domain-containing protein
MLTATYALVALSVEQTNVRVNLLAFQKYVHANLRHRQSVTPGQLYGASDGLHRLYQACHWRKIEMYLIPAVRLATRQADQLLDELSGLTRAALDIVNSIQQRCAGVAQHTEEQVAQVCAGVDDFCGMLLRRLEIEERDLFAIARRAIGGETWFTIADQFLRHDAQVVDRRRDKARAIMLEEPKTLPPVPPELASLRVGHDERLEVAERTDRRERNQQIALLDRAERIAAGIPPRRTVSTLVSELSE